MVKYMIEDQSQSKYSIDYVKTEQPSDAILLVVRSPTVKSFAEYFFANDLMGTLIMTYAKTVPSWFLLNLKVVQVT